MTDVTSARKLHSVLKSQTPEMLAALKTFVLAESPSVDKNLADKCCGVIAAAWRRRGAEVERISQKRRGDHLKIIWRPQMSRPQGQLLVLGHYDTVYSAGSLAKMPFRIARGKAFGPGVFDMKAGIVQALFALDALQRCEITLPKRLVFLWTSDEEIGSASSRKIIEQEARRSDAVFVLEPSFGPTGLLKTVRKGVGEAKIVVHGREAHAGLAPQEGVNAIHELALHLSAMQKWNDLRRGITMNACIASGGTHASNVIPAQASAILDLRAPNIAGMRQLERRLHLLRPILPGARIEVTGGFTRPPLEHKMSASLFKLAKSLARSINLDLGECAVGGGSDGNFTAALGIPTLDGLGAVGHGAHSPAEHIIVNALPVRAALLAALLIAA
jgi:glutamate carboxypeptidase